MNQESFSILFEILGQVFDEEKFSVNKTNCVRFKAPVFVVEMNH